MAKTFDIDVSGHSVDHQPVAGDHDAVGTMGTAQDESRNRIAGARKAQFVQRE
jgi:hypothetical protein